MKVLIIQQKMIGDVLTSSILFEALKDRYPESELHYVINSHTFPVIKNNPFIDKIHFFTPEIEKSTLKLIALAQQLRKEKYDVVIDVYSKLSSALITLFSGAKKRISKHKHYTAFIYSHTFNNLGKSSSNAGLAIENRMQLLKPLETTTNNYKPKIYLTSEEQEHAKEFLLKSKINLSKPLFMISVIGSGTTKTYPEKEMAKFIDSTANNVSESQILFNYIPKQERQARTIYEMCTAQTQKQIFFDVFGKSLREFFSITKFCTAVVGNEGGAINMAKALNIPTFAIFSPWIKKEDWTIYDDGVKSVSVHLQDFEPSIYKNVTHLKSFKKDALDLYSKFNFELFQQQFIDYLNQFKNT